MKWETTCTILFVLFFISWIITRHVLFGIIIYSVCVHPQKHIIKCWDYEKSCYYSRPIIKTFIAFLLSLQLLMFVWLKMIIRIVVMVLKGKDPQDIRSDDEESEVSEIDEDNKDFKSVEMLKQSSLYVKNK